MKPIIAQGEIVRSALADYIAEFKAKPEAADHWTQDYLDRLEKFVTCGKQLRGGLVCWTYQTFANRQPSRDTIRVAMALEICHSALLIHDDIIDNDPVRRGQPAWHVQYERLGQRRGVNQPAWFGTGMAICGGDMSFLLAYNLLACLDAKGDVSADINRRFSTALLHVFAGQMDDIYFDASPKLPAKSAIYKLMEAKTAAYTVALPLALGARLANVAPSVIENLEDLGLKTGVIFQIRDDELGLFGNSDTLGKPVGSDLREGKKNLPYFYLAKMASASEKQRLEKLFGNPAITKSDITYAQSLALKYDVAGRLAADSGRLIKQARISIDGLSVSNAAKSELREMVAFCATRQS